MQSGKVELQPVGQDMARVTMTVDCDPALVPAERQGNPEAMVAQRIEDDLARFKQFIEERGSETGEWRGEVHDAQVTQQDAAQSSPTSQAGESTQSEAALSQSMDDDAEDGRYSVAEEQNFDQQSNQARRVGQMPLDFSAPVPGETDPSEAMAKSVKTDDKADLKQSIERSVPPSE
jgi:hypothetical protein